MKYYTHNDKDIDVKGTNWQNDLGVSYDRLVKAFGEPITDWDPKTDAEWYIETEDGVVITIYDYKIGKNYLGNTGLPADAITYWHIGGFNKDKDHKRIIINILKEVENERS